MPKQKSISDSNLVGTSRHNSSQSFPARLSKQMPTRNGGPVTTTGTNALQKPPSTVSPSLSFSTMPSLMEKTNGTDLLAYQFSSDDTTNGTSCSPAPSSFSSIFPSSAGITDAPPKISTSILAAASAPDSGYFQMPNSLQEGANEFSDLTSPLTPPDSDVGSFSSMDPSVLGISAKPPPNPSYSSISSDYLSGPDSSNSAWPPSMGSETSECPSSMFGGGESEALSPFVFSSSYVPSGTSYANSEPDGLKPLTVQGDDLFDGDDFSSTDKASTLLTSSSSQSSALSPSSCFHGSQDTQTIVYSQSTSTSSDYLPSLNTSYPQASGPPDSSEHGLAWENNGFGAAPAFFDEAFGQSNEPAMTTTANTSSSHISFPVSFNNNDNEGVDFDDFDLPPLPDSLNVPTTSGSSYSFGGGNEQSSQGSYGGSIVTLGNSTSNN